MKGYFRKRGKSWYFTIDVGIDPKTGRRKQKTKGGFKTKKEAQAEAAKLHHELTTGLYVDEKKLLLNDFFETWLKTYEKKVTESTVRIRKGSFDRFKKEIGNIDMNKITHKMYQTAIDNLAEKYSWNTVQAINSTIKLMYKKAKQMEMVIKDPTQYAELPKKPSKKGIQFIEKDELGYLLDVAKQEGLDQDYTLFTVLAYSGMRITELLALKKTDLNFKENTIDINKIIFNPKNNRHNYKLTPTKTENSSRVIKMDERVMRLLKKHLTEQNEIKLLNPEYDNQEFVFADYDGKPFTHAKAHYRFKRILEKSELDDSLTLHMFRHTHISLLIESGARDKEIMERVGHADIKTTMNIYAHLTKDMENTTVERFSEHLKSYHEL